MKEESFAFTAGKEEAGKRLDVVLADVVMGLSRNVAGQLIRNGEVTVNGRPAKTATKLADGDEVRGTYGQRTSLRAEPEDIPLDIVYRDPDLAVINKPAGLVVHPAAGHRGGTLANALTNMFPVTEGVGTPERPGIVHRLDKDTSGLMVVALRPEALTSLQAQIAGRTAGRRYLALVAGHPVPAEATVDAPIGRDERNRQRMATHGIAARPARSTYRVLEELPGYSLIEVTLHTGRTHQIRVHMAAVGHPIAGDSLYGGPDFLGLERQFLHAYRLSVQSPSTGNRMEFEAGLPADLERVLAALRTENGP